MTECPADIEAVAGGLLGTLQWLSKNVALLLEWKETLEGRVADLEGYRCRKTEEEERASAIIRSVRERVFEVSDGGRHKLQGVEEEGEVVDRLGGEVGQLSPLGSLVVRTGAMCSRLHVRQLAMHRAQLQTQAKVLRDQTVHALRLRYFNQLRYRAKVGRKVRKRRSNQRRIAEALLSTNEKVMLSRCFRAFARLPAVRRERERVSRIAVHLLANTEQAIRGKYYTHLSSFCAMRRARNALADSLSCMSHRALRWRTWEKLLAMAKSRMSRKRKDALAQGMALGNLKLMRQIFWRKLSRYPAVNKQTRAAEAEMRKKRRIRRRAVMHLLTTSERFHRMEAFKRWHAFWVSRSRRTSRERMAQLEQDIDQSRREMNTAMVTVQHKITEYSKAAEKQQEETAQAMKFQCAEAHRAVNLLREQQKVAFDQFHVEHRSQNQVFQIMQEELREALHRSSQEQAKEIAMCKEHCLQEVALCREHSERLREEELGTLHSALAHCDNVLAEQQRLVDESVALQLKNLEQNLADMVAQDREKVQHDIDTKWDVVSKKVGTVVQQVDISLKSLSNTNTVLNKVVDRLISVDLQLETLDKGKVSKQEFKSIQKQWQMQTGVAVEELSPALTNTPRNVSPTRASTPSQWSVPGSPRMSTQPPSPLHEPRKQPRPTGKHDTGEPLPSTPSFEATLDRVKWRSSQLQQKIHHDPRKD